MKTLIVAATYLEIKEILKIYNFEVINNEFYSFKKDSIEIDILISGIGIAFTVYYLTKKLADKNYDLVINIGIAGSFNKNLNIGDVVFILEEQFADLGIENKNDFETLFETGFISENKKPFINGKLINESIDDEIFKDFLKVKGITVNKVSGNANSVNNIQKKFNSDIESMEGAAFFYVCLMEKVKFIQIRAVSNYVEERNKENWNIPLAISNLTASVNSLLSRFNNI
ncbi:MAG: futalosine hydrolase [Bacteroidales bacterium]|nr:futalosine hydrolase [Bacteroidales bacterium]MBN2758661.1 futalosine hydrolase [Bacteroidales bacterium]